MGKLKTSILSINRYGVSVSQMTTDMFRLSSSQSGPFPIHDLSPGLYQE
jgi:hypothetical protein